MEMIVLTLLVVLYAGYRLIQRYLRRWWAGEHLEGET